MALQLKHGSIISEPQAKSAKDDALREVLVNRQTYRHVTHRVLQERNAEGQTLLAIIEVNRVNLAESLPIVLKKEYGCHRRDILKTEQCLSRQLESSMSSGQIIMELNDLENSNSLSKRMKIWTIIFCRSFLNDKFVLPVTCNIYIVMMIVFCPFWFPFASCVCVCVGHDDC